MDDKPVKETPVSGIPEDDSEEMATLEMPPDGDIENATTVELKRLQRREDPTEADTLVNASVPETETPETEAPETEAPAKLSVRPEAGGCFLRALNAFDLTRRIVVNVLFLAFLVFGGLFFLFFLAALAGGGEAVVPVPSSAALILEPRGMIVEQLAGDPLDRALKKLLESEIPESLLDDLTDAVISARDDDRIKVLVLDLNQLLGANIVKAQALRAAIYDFKESGKPVIATADVYSGARYHLATAADEIYLHKEGAILIEGYGIYRTYYGDTIRRFLVDWNIFRVGEYKSAVEPYLYREMSQEVEDSNKKWLGGLWEAYLDDVAEGRNMEADDIAAITDQFHVLLSNNEGDPAEMALNLGLVDHVAHRDELRDHLVELVGEDKDTQSFKRIHHLDYLKHVKRSGPRSDERVAVLVARGVIVDGDAPPGTIGGNSTARLIREARLDEKVKALVLRVDSGGGSAFASEVIRRELELFRDAGKSVVISMGSYAASGGYWIATSADEIWASPNTVTGSIGIFGMFPTFQRTLDEYLSINVDGFGTTWMAGVRPDRKLDERMHETITRIVEHGYEDFLERVGLARGMSRDEVDSVAQGEVFNGRQALEKGLIDQLGDLEDAIASAAKIAGLEEGYGVELLEKELDPYDQMMIDLLETASIFYKPPTQRPAAISGLAERIWRDSLAELDLFNDPMGVYAHCLCTMD